MKRNAKSEPLDVMDSRFYVKHMMAVNGTCLHSLRVFFHVLQTLHALTGRSKTCCMLSIPFRVSKSALRGWRNPHSICE